MFKILYQHKETDKSLELIILFKKLAEIPNKFSEQSAILVKDTIN